MRGIAAELTAAGPRCARNAALRMLRGSEGEWQAPVVTCSALHNEGLDNVWRHVRRHRDWLVDRGDLDAKRRRQLVDWTRALVRDRLLSRLDTVKDVVAATEAAVQAGDLTPDQAAAQKGDQRQQHRPARGLEQVKQMVGVELNHSGVPSRRRRSNSIWPIAQKPRR